MLAVHALHRMIHARRVWCHGRTTFPGGHASLRCVCARCAARCSGPPWNACRTPCSQPLCTARALTRPPPRPRGHRHNHPARVQFKPVLTLGFFTITAVFLVFGAVGYAAFGEATRDVITHNLPDGWSKNLVNLALCCALFFTFPVMMVPVYEILEKAADASEWFQHSVSPLKRCASAPPGLRH